MAQGDGRNQVESNTIVATAWGNAIADRTVQSFASVGEMTQQWAAPQPGAMAYTEAEAEFWFQKPSGDGWKRLPLGYIGGAQGPAAYLQVKATITTLAQYNFTSTNGRVYRVTARGACTQRVKGGSGYARYYFTDSVGTQWYDHLNDPQVGDIMATSGGYLFRANASGAAWVRLSAMTTIAGGYIDFAAKGCSIWVEDVGG